MTRIIPLRSMCLIIGKPMKTLWSVLCTLHVLYLDRIKRSNALLIVSTAPIELSKNLKVSSELTPTTCEKILKLHIVPLLKLIITVYQVAAPVAMSMCRLSTSRLAVDYQDLKSNEILKTNSTNSLKSNRINSWIG